MNIKSTLIRVNHIHREILINTGKCWLIFGQNPLPPPFPEIFSWKDDAILPRFHDVIVIRARVRHLFFFYILHMPFFMSLLQKKAPSYTLGLRLTSRGAIPSNIATKERRVWNVRTVEKIQRRRSRKISRRGNAKRWKDFQGIEKIFKESVKKGIANKMCIYIIFITLFNVYINREIFHYNCVWNFREEKNMRSLVLLQLQRSRINQTK